MIKKDSKQWENLDLKFPGMYEVYFSLYFDGLDYFSSLVLLYSSFWQNFNEALLCVCVCVCSSEAVFSVSLSHVIQVSLSSLLPLMFFFRN